MSAGTADATYVREAGPPGTRFSEIRHFAELDSTNRYLLDEARRSPRDGLVAVADHQTAGRGRLGRRWEAPPGVSLLVSVLVIPRLPMEQLHLCSVALALAAAEACRQAIGLAPAVKWPNDLVVGPRKLAGVLAESVPLLGSPGRGGPGPGGPGQGGSSMGEPGQGRVVVSPERRAVVVGAGVNVGWPPPDGHPGDQPVPPELQGLATSLWRETGRRMEPRVLLELLLADLEHRLVELDDPAGRMQLAHEYRARCTTLGRTVQVVVADGERQGTAIDITSEGHLVLDVGAGFVTVTAGDVVHVQAAS
jgi:BirA family biotin operon repressor/biotin-[acetyl-CoA-carboxylase] ligase